RRREAQQRQVRLRRQALQAAQRVGDVLLLRQDVAQRLEAVLEIGDLCLEFRQAARRRDALVDVGLQRAEMRALQLQFRIEAGRVEVIEAVDGAGADGDASSKLAPPRKFAERDIDLCPTVPGVRLGLPPARVPAEPRGSATSL